MVLGAPPLAETGLDRRRRDVKWLPHHRFEITSPLKPADALAAMQAHTEPEKLLRWRMPSSANDSRFEGEVRGDGFHVRRIIGYRNSFLPVIDAAVNADGRGSRIVGTMRLFMVVYAFMAVWAIGAAAVAIDGSTAGDPIFLVVGVLMLAFLYLMTMGGFWFEASKQERTLRAIFQAKDEPQLIS